MQYNELFIDTKFLKPMKKEELYRYFEKMKLGDMNARNEIINHNIRLVIHEVIKKFSNTPYELKELVSVGLIGLIKSVDTFDTSKEIQFATYSTRCINNEILMFMRKGKKYINDISLDQPIGTDQEGKELRFEDTLSDNKSDFVSEYEEDYSYKIIRKVVEQLPERDKNILMKHFGFIDNNPMTQKEIADELGISQSYVSRVIKKNLKYVSIQLKQLGIIETSIIEMPKKINTIKKEESKRGYDKVSRKLQTIYEYFNKYTREQVNEMLSKLSEEELLLITLRYGKDLDNPVTSKDWNNENSKQYYGILIPKMKKLLSNPGYIYKSRQNKTNNERVAFQENIVNSKMVTEIKTSDYINQDLENNEEIPILKEDYIKILDLLKTANFNQILNVLSPKEAIIVCLKLGYVDGKYFSTESISKFLGIEEDEVIESTKKVLLLYRDNINDVIDKAVEYTIEQQKQVH